MNGGVKGVWGGRKLDYTLCSYKLCYFKSALGGVTLRAVVMPELLPWQKQETLCSVNATPDSILKIQQESARGSKRNASETLQPAEALSLVITVSR